MRRARGAKRRRGCQQGDETSGNQRKRRTGGPGKPGPLLRDGKFNLIRDPSSLTLAYTAGFVRVSSCSSDPQPRRARVSLPGGSASGCSMADAEWWYREFVTAHADVEKSASVVSFHRYAETSAAALDAAWGELERVRQENRFWLERPDVDDEDQVRCWIRRLRNVHAGRSCDAVATLNRALSDGLCVKEALLRARARIPALEPDVPFTLRCDL